MTIKKSYDDSRSPSIDKFKQVVLSEKIPSHAMEAVKKAMEDLTGMNSGTPEYDNTLAYIDHLIQLPWNSKTPDMRNPDTLDGLLSKVLKDSPDAVKTIHDNIASVLMKKNKRATILIVDDEKIALKNMSLLLKKEGYNVETCDNGEEAVERITAAQFDIVITDLRMANINGIQVLEKTKSLSPDTQVILITGYATTETAVEAMRKGAFHYIMKPVQIDELRVIIKDALRIKEAGRHEGSLLCIACDSQTLRSDIGRAIAEGTGRKFTEISLENIREERDLFGVSRVNGGSSPGCIMKSVSETGTSNPLIMLHDIDKLDSALLLKLHEELKSERNCSFVDRYFEVPFDLSGAIFITATGSTEGVSSRASEHLHFVRINT